MVATTDICLALVASWLLYKLLTRSTSRQTTSLRGPKSTSFIFGLSQILREALDSSVLLNKWGAEYGSVFRVPIIFNATQIVLQDPKAIIYYYSKTDSVYLKAPTSKKFIEVAFGRNLVWADGEVHRRQRKSLTPAFATVAIRNYVAAFYDSAYKLCGRWDSILENDDKSPIEVQKWMNRIALDSIGITGFSHDFQTLEDKPSVFETIDWTTGTAWFAFLTTVGAKFPLIMNLPSEKMRTIGKMRTELAAIAEQLYSKGKDSGIDDKSIIGLLIKSSREDASHPLTQDEVVAQMNVLFLAGYETTSISLTWCLIELCRNPDIQARLREELSDYGSSDPTYEELMALPYLDAVVLEILRTHPPVEESPRVAAEDDVIPLGTPVQTASGEIIDRIFVSKGTPVSVNNRSMNLSEAFWGPDAREFNPDRWLSMDNDSVRAKEIQGHHHMLTFGDGPRMCLGKQFALAEFKAVISVLVRKYSYELPGGPATQFGKEESILPRPKVLGEKGASVPLLVRHI